MVNLIFLHQLISKPTEIYHPHIFLLIQNKCPSKKSFEGHITI